MNEDGEDKRCVAEQFEYKDALTFEPFRYRREDKVEQCEP
jgi:hypothetical protein